MCVYTCILTVSALVAVTTEEVVLHTYSSSYAELLTHVISDSDYLQGGEDTAGRRSAVSACVHVLPLPPFRDLV